MPRPVPLALALLLAGAGGCARRQPAGAPVAYDESGLASYVGDALEGRPTASGERYRGSDLTAAHRSIAFGTRVRVTNLANGRSVVVRINDRGPFVGDRIIDLSRGAAERLDLVRAGVGRVRVRTER
jgi:rare lipoprotein A